MVRTAAVEPPAAGKSSSGPESWRGELVPPVLETEIYFQYHGFSDRDAVMEAKEPYPGFILYGEPYSETLLGRVIGTNRMCPHSELLCNA
jgi:hypothetical protein